jgi:hypothetical protein
MPGGGRIFATGSGSGSIIQEQALPLVVSIRVPIHIVSKINHLAHRIVVVYSSIHESAIIPGKHRL